MPSLRSKQSWPLGVNKGPNKLMLTKRGQTQMLGHIVGDYFYTPDIGKDKWEVWGLSDLTPVEVHEISITESKDITLKPCACCGKKKHVDQMKTCMHAQMHRYVCDTKCMSEFYKKL
jgi:hypothetical protein